MTNNINLDLRVATEDFQTTLTVFNQKGIYLNHITTSVEKDHTDFFVVNVTKAEIDSIAAYLVSVGVTLILTGRG